MKLLNSIEELFQLNNRIKVAGAGNNGRILGKFFNVQNICWNGYVDRTPIVSKLNGKEIKKYSDIQNDDGSTYIISSTRWLSEIKSELNCRGITDNDIICVGSDNLLTEIAKITEKYYSERIRRFKNKYKGKRCFIIGNGPSLLARDLDYLVDDVCFASNSIFAIYKETKWRPTFYFATDPDAISGIASDKEVLNTVLSNCNYFFSQINQELFYRGNIADEDRIEYLRLQREYYFGQRPLFSENCHEVVFIGGTVTYYCLQMAAYMGFTEIYLLGVDCDFSGWTEGGIAYNPSIEEENTKFGYKQLESKDEIVDLESEQTEAYKSAKVYADSKGIKIFNATRGGKLGVFERVNFSELV